MYYKTIKISLFFYLSFTNYKHIIFINLNSRRCNKKKKAALLKQLSFDNRGWIYLFAF
jgi:hypothetical protein